MKSTFNGYKRWFAWYPVRAYGEWPWPGFWLVWLELVYYRKVEYTVYTFIEEMESGRKVKYYYEKRKKETFLRLRENNTSKDW